MAWTFDAEVWLYTGDGAWHFVTVPADVSDDIAARTASNRRGFGSVPVEVTIGDTSWKTSVFPDKKRGAYILPVKKTVRTAEDLHDGAVATVTLSLSMA